MFHQFNKFLTSELPNFTATDYTLREKIFIISNDKKAM